MGKVGQIQNNARTEEVAQLVKHLLPHRRELLLTSGTVGKATHLSSDGTHPIPRQGGQSDGLGSGFQSWLYHLPHTFCNIYESWSLILPLPQEDFPKQIRRSELG